MSADDQRSILITGAGRGIGRALALRFAARAAAEKRPCHLILTARTPENLARTAEECRERGATVTTHHFDMEDTVALRQWLSAADEEHPIGCAILNAGMSDGLVPGELVEAAAKTRRQVAVNLLAPVEAVDILAQRMAKRGEGKIALVGSLAAFTPLPDSPGYCASKAGLRLYANSVRPFLKRAGIGLTLVMPGFVETDMSRRMKGWQPFRVSTERAALIIEQGIRRKRGQIAFPLPMVILCRFLDLLPSFLRDIILMRGVRYEIVPEKTDAA